MSGLKNIRNNNYEYSQYSDYVFKTTVGKYANGVLKFLKIPYTIQNIISSEYASFGPKIHRLDFVGEVKKDGTDMILILECQSNLPTDDDIMRFFQYVSTLRVFKNRSVELYILCFKEAPYTKKEFVINDECIYTMNVISLKDYKASQILKNVENKIRNNSEVSDEDIASLQLIAYTDYSETTLEILEKTYSLIEQLSIEKNEKEALKYILDVLSANMLNKNEKKRLMEKIEMGINPREDYFTQKGREVGIEEGIREGIQKGREEEKLEIAINLLNDGMSIEKICKITGLSKDQIERGIS